MRMIGFLCNFSQICKVEKIALLVVILGFLGACGSSEDAENTTSATTYTFEGDVASIVKASCAQNGGCHEAANSGGNTVYVDHRDNFVANKTEILDRINARGAIMPQEGSGLNLSIADKALLESYLGQTKQE